MGILTGKAVVITGAGRGLGRAFAEAAARAGASIVVNDIDAEPAREVVRGIEAGCAGSALLHVGSVAEWDAAHQLIETCVERFGRIDGLVNNAGSHYLSRPEDEDEVLVRESVETNVLGTIFPGVHAMRAMIRQGKGGVIVNSTSGAMCGMSMVATYGATKGAVTSLTYSWALDLMAHGIRCNAISATALTRMTEHTLQHRASPVDWPPETMAPLVVYLLSDLSRGITGQMIRLWGGNLHLIGHPAPIAPFVERDGWSVEDLDAAFREHLSAHLQPFARDESCYEWRGPAS
jgi:NAD(P)-dependent dehydrogenase (short-subunit alcohol dehydrogenase family)